MNCNYYNENDPKAAAWLRELIRCGHIPEGDVDERSIADVKPADLRKYTQHHFFAGIAGWSYALRLAGWPAERPVWTGSCPCQSFSSAGKQLGNADARHLWPVFFNLIRECRPERVFGEQVENAINHGWLDSVSADLEAEGYAVGAAVLGAHSVGAPHRRQRLYWVADANSERRAGQHSLLREDKIRRIPGEIPEVAGCGLDRAVADAQHPVGRALGGPGQDVVNGHDAGRAEAHGQLGTCGEVRPLADAHGRKPGNGGLQRGRQYGQQPEDGGAGSVDHADGERAKRPRPVEQIFDAGRETGAMDKPDRPRPEGKEPHSEGDPRDQARLRVLGGGQPDGAMEHPRSDGRQQRGAEPGGRCAEYGRTNGVAQGDTHLARPQGRGLRPVDNARSWAAWTAGVDFIACTDGRKRLAQSGTFPLAHGVSGRVGLLRGYGNAIVPQVAAAFIQAAEAARTDINGLPHLHVRVEEPASKCRIFNFDEA